MTVCVQILIVKETQSRWRMIVSLNWRFINVTEHWTDMRDTVRQAWLCGHYLLQQTQGFLRDSKFAVWPGIYRFERERHVSRYLPTRGFEQAEGWVTWAVKAEKFPLLQIVTPVMSFSPPVFPGPHQQSQRVWLPPPWSPPPPNFIYNYMWNRMSWLSF